MSAGQEHEEALAALRSPRTQPLFLYRVGNRHSCTILVGEPSYYSEDGNLFNSECEHYQMTLAQFKRSNRLAKSIRLSVRRRLLSGWRKSTSDKGEEKKRDLSTERKVVTTASQAEAEALDKLLFMQENSSRECLEVLMIYDGAPIRAKVDLDEREWCTVSGRLKIPVHFIGMQSNQYTALFSSEELLKAIRGAEAIGFYMVDSYIRYKVKGDNDNKKTVYIEVKWSNGELSWEPALQLMTDDPVGVNNWLKKEDMSEDMKYFISTGKSRSIRSSIKTKIRNKKCEKEKEDVTFNVSTGRKRSRSRMKSLSQQQEDDLKVTLPRSKKRPCVVPPKAENSRPRVVRPKAENIRSRVVRPKAENNRPRMVRPKAENNRPRMIRPKAEINRPRMVRPKAEINRPRMVRPKAGNNRLGVVRPKAGNNRLGVVRPQRPRLVRPKAENNRKSSDSRKKNSRAKKLTKEEIWLQNFDRLKEILNEYGHCRVNGMPGVEKPFHRWIKTQREVYKSRKMRLDRFELLQGISFPWEGSLSYQSSEQVEIMKDLDEAIRCDFQPVIDRSLAEREDDLEMSLLSLSDMSTTEDETSSSISFEDKRGSPSLETEFAFCNEANICERSTSKSSCINFLISECMTEENSFTF